MTQNFHGNTEMVLNTVVLCGSVEFCGSVVLG